MRKAYFLLIPLLIWGCEKTYDNLIDTSTENFQVSDVVFIDHSFPIVYDLKNPADSLLKLRINFTQQSVVNKSFFDVYASDNSRLNPSPIEMQEVTQNIFENQLLLKREYPIGNYTVRFSASGLDGKTKQVAVGSFYFNNGQDNVAPVISNLVMPDSVQRGNTIIFSVEVSDSNGLNDIEFVFYEAYNPDGIKVVNSQGISQFPMFDDGKTQENGDVTAGDGIYTVVLTFPVSAQTGIWRFEFLARDRSKALSNKIIHNIVVH